MKQMSFGERTTRRTSLDAFRKITQEGLLTKRRLEVYEALYHHGPCTASELAETLPGKQNRTIGSNVHARLGELRTVGVAMELPPRTCSISGMKTIVWQVTDQLPDNAKLKEKKLKLCPHCGGEL